MRDDRPETAHLLLARGISVETVAMCTGLGKARIRRIAREAAERASGRPAPVWATPVWATPVWATPVWATPVWATPVWATPVGATPVETVPSAVGAAGPERAGETGARRVSLLDLTARMCRWPLGHPGDEDFRFCGAPTDGPRSYCATHCARAYRACREG